jgi:predicted ribosome quality control (RQC) complex YloA/Tae2 family protein
MDVKKEITSLDLRFLIPELKAALIDARFRKIYQYGRAGTKQLLFEVYKPGVGENWVYVNSSKIFLTKYKKAVPQEPPNFCMFLRKHLMGKRIINIKQYEFDRIVELITNDNVLIFELIHPGNVILCDSSYKIIMPLEIQHWKDRDIKPKIPYRYPPHRINPFELDFDGFRKLLSESDKKIIVLLAVNLGFGSVYASEICLRANINENRIASDIRLEEMLRLHKTIESLDKIKMNPCIYNEIASPFPLNGLKSEPKQVQTFSEALDEFFSEQKIEAVKEERMEIIKEEKERIKRILTQQTESIRKWERIEKESRENAEAIYNYYSIVEGILSGIKKARDMDIPWNEIKEKIKTEGSPEAEVIKEIREGDAVVVVELGGKEIELDIRKSAEENAVKYFEDAKWAREKMKSALSAKEEQEERLEEVKDMEITEPVLVKKKEPKKEWYEKFKWFFSSDGFLVIAGRNAEQNEMIIKKHTEPKDLVFHADIPGAAFVVIKSQGMEIPDETKKEATEFAAANSKAWNRGLGTIDIYCVPPSQVSKSPPPGEYLPKGSFMIYGERKWYRDIELRLSVGVKIDRTNEQVQVISGPVMAIRKNSDYFVTIKPGFKKSLELAETIKNKILIKAKPEDKFLIERVPLDEFQCVIPAGMGEVIEYG